MQANDLVQKSFEYQCDEQAKTYLVQYDIPGSPRGDWVVKVEMEASSWPGYGAYTGVILFNKAVEDGLNRGVENDGCYVSWYKSGETPLDGYTKLVDEDGDKSKFNQGRKFKSNSGGGFSGNVYSITYKLDLSGSGEGCSIGIIGGKIADNITKLKFRIDGFNQ